MIPPNARLHADAERRMLGGSFQLVTDATSRPGRLDPAAPLHPAAPLTLDDLYAALHAPVADRAPVPIVRYEGLPGSGRTYALEHHHADPALRRVYLDCRIHSHKSLLVDCIQQCGSAADARQHRHVDLAT